MVQMQEKLERVPKQPESARRGFEPYAGTAKSILTRLSTISRRRLQEYSQNGFVSLLSRTRLRAGTPPPLGKQRLMKVIDKPSQEHGTLLSLPVTKSFLKKDAISRSRNSSQYRDALVKALAELLEEEYVLATTSADYQRTSFTSRDSDSKTTSFNSTRTTSTSSFATAAEGDNSKITSRSVDMSRKKQNAEPIPSKKRAAVQQQELVSKAHHFSVLDKC